MKASVITKYGSPDVIQIKEVAQPRPKDNEVLIKNHATVVGQADCAFRKGDPFIIKLVFGLKKPRFSIGGSVIAGEIEAVGNDVKTFKKGDQVFGFNPSSFGAHAEYLCMPEDGSLVIKSPSMTYEESTGICDGGF